MKKKTFTTVMPDKVGAFMGASKIISSLGLNITRVSYNKAVDVHMLFIEVEGQAKKLLQAEKALKEIGYLGNYNDGRIILIEFTLRDVPGSVLSVLELINTFKFNISYMSSQENGTDFQHFRMGLYIENSDDMSDFLKKASSICQVKVLDYDRAEKVLDNTIFYVTFANAIAETVGFDNEEKSKLIVDSNLIMENLDARSGTPRKTFEYIGKFADELMKYKGENFLPRTTDYEMSGLKLKLIEPPCGSNICILDAGEGLLFVDSGFSCYKDEMVGYFKKNHIDLDGADVVITHADVDHCGLLDLFENVFLSQKCYDNFFAENNGKDNLRETNYLHSPYVKISKILSSYHPPELKRMKIVGGTSNPISDFLERIGELKCHGLDFEVYEGCGGHISGEIILIERKRKLAFTGDIFINLKGFTKEQKSFNRLAPYLMTSVDTDPTVAAKERQAFLSLLDGQEEWLIIGGHASAIHHNPMEK